MGEKYGSIRVPGEVESAEFEMILDAAVEAGLDTHILEEWYCRDENAVPPAYYLKPKAQMLKNFQNSVSLDNMLFSNCSAMLKLLKLLPWLVPGCWSSLRWCQQSDTVLSALSLSDGVNERSQNQEWQGLEERRWGDQEDLQNGSAAPSREGDHEERRDQEIPLLWLVSTPLIPAF